jgi:DNA-binding response OmpR family regulator
LQQGLEEEGYTVSSAADGSLALKNPKENFDLILLDWMLPKMTGLELCKTIRLKNNTTNYFFDC